MYKAKPNPILSIVHNYFEEVRAIKATGAGVAETSYYPALFNLLNGMGKGLKPCVHAVSHLANLGAGIPDGGFFDADQFKRGQKDTETLKGQLPSRGALEVKSEKEKLNDIGTGEQVAKYLDLYGLVLVTNLRGFALYKKGHDGPLEHLELASSPETFRILLNDKSSWATHATPLAEFLTRVLQAAAPLTTPESVAWFLASYAREAKHRIEHAPLEELAPLKKALSEALKLNFTGEEGEGFFRATLVQALWYGLFSAWMMHMAKPNAGEKGAPAFNWRMAAWEMHLPVMQIIFSQLANPSAQRSLKLADLLDRTAETLARVDLESFNAHFAKGDAVQYFYEPFLAAYDPDLRRQFGVWYTPKEVVEYMVERVDEALRSELGLAKGLADPSVYVLDPATGTGSYLTAVLARIEKTLKAQPDWDDASAEELKKAATERLYGFEIMPAPYVIAHMRMSQQLAKSGQTLDEGERAAIYLTNALTNWHNISPTLPNMPELQAEQDAAQHIKHEQPVLVILGNPPYNAFAGTSTSEEGDLIDVYKKGLASAWGIKRFNLDDLYIRFFRVAERKIGETGRGVVCFITPFSYLTGASFVVMRQKLLSEFDRISIDSLNGDSRQTGKLTPEGLPDPSIFSTALNREGIRVGTAVSLLVKTGQETKQRVQYRDFWGVGKAGALLNSLSGGGPAYETVRPTAENRYRLQPMPESGEYETWPKVVELAGNAALNGLMEKRSGGLISFSKAELQEKMMPYFDKSIPWEKYININPELSKPAANYKPIVIREKAIGKYSKENIVEYFLRPFEIRWAYYSNISTLWNSSRPKLWKQLPGNSFLVTRPASAATDEGVPFFWTSKLGDNDALKGHANYIPIFWHIGDKAASITEANLSPMARQYLSALGAANPNTCNTTAALLWHHALAIGFSNAYLSENAAGIAADWPRVPLPNNLQALQDSARLGARLAELLDNANAETANELGPIGRLKKVNEQAASTQGYAVQAGWGNLQRGNVVMPGRGRTTERPAEGLPAALGTQVLDIALNDGWIWENVPLPVWNFTVGGYQVMKKWLSYREFSVLGRSLELEEAREVSRMARRIAEIVLLEDELNANYQRARENVWHSQMTTKD